MPRPRKIVMEGISKEDTHAAAIRRSIQLYSPYVVVDGELVDSEFKYAVVYVAPRGGDRVVVAGRNKRANATAIRDLLMTAWAEGFWSSGKE
jgi:hypothetical protein